MILFKKLFGKPEIQPTETKIDLENHIKTI